MSSPFSFGTRVLGAAAVVMMLFLGVGVILPHTWNAERSARMVAPPEVVFGFLDSPEGWRRWTAWPDSGLDRAGPERGAGARISWSSQDLGSGAFQITEATPTSFLRYRVEVQQGAMITEGSVELAPEGAGTLVTWREEGDFGRNPLMGYWARGMARAQGGEMERSLARLDSLSAATVSVAGSGEP